MSDERTPTTITITGVFEGYPVSVEFAGKPSQLPAVVERLRAAGIEPPKPAAPATKAKRQAVEPWYQPDGTPCCPKHQKPLREGQYGLFCPAKDDAGKNGYCDLKFAA